MNDVQKMEEKATSRSFNKGIAYLLLATLCFMFSFLLSWSCMSKTDEIICFGSGICFLVFLVLGIKSFRDHYRN